MRRAQAMTLAAGFVRPRLRSYGYVQVEEAEYMLNVLARGADSLVARQVVGPELGEALKREGRRRAAEGSFFGHVAYVSVVAQKS